MKWTDYFDRIVVFNLRKRQDRLIDITEQMELYDIPFELVTSIEHENGAEGLKLTLEKTLNESLSLGHKNILIFEDDALFNQPKDIVDDTMTKALSQLPQYWHILFLGAQVTRGFTNRMGSNLLSLVGAFATHAWAISEQGMKEILNAGLLPPIDNFLVEKVQPMGGAFITYPLLCTQRAGMSDIGKTEIQWDAFITPRYYQKLAESNL